MKIRLQTLAILILVITAAAWLVTGANRGWTKTQVPVKTLDEVTGIEGITWHKTFQPGVDWLGAGVMIALGLCLSAQFFGSSNKSKPNKTKI
jgi:hypothetical protein